MLLSCTPWNHQKTKDSLNYEIKSFANVFMGYWKETLGKIIKNILDINWTHDKFQDTLRNVTFYWEDLCNIYEETKERQQFYFQ